MRMLRFATFLVAVSGGYFALSATTGLGNVPPTPAIAALAGMAGLSILLKSAWTRANRKVNAPPMPPYYMIDGTGGGILELDADGSYESCQRLLTALAEHFDAEYAVHLDSGPQPHSDKDKGYWNITMFDQEFFLMRDRGYGICISGPKHGTDTSGFLRLTKHFKATEFRTWQQKLMKRPASIET